MKKATNMLLWVGAFGILGYSIKKQQDAARKAKCIKSKCVADAMERGATFDEATAECCK